MDVNQLLQNNRNHLQTIFGHYKHKKDGFTVESATILLESQNLSISLIERLFRYSKMTVMSSSRTDRNHYHLTYVEFLELLCRLAAASALPLKESLLEMLHAVYNQAYTDKVLDPE